MAATMSWKRSRRFSTGANPWTISLFALYLDLEGIDHTRTKTKSPQTNGICERFHQTIQNEFYASAFRRKLYTSLDQLQADVDHWVRSYNEERPHSGKHCFGKTPWHTSDLKSAAS
jgi:transposase InsO family protein